MSNARRNELAKIHMAKKGLGLDDEEYRDVLWTVCRVRSAKDLDSYGRHRLLAHFRERGWRPKRRRHPGQVAGGRGALIGKIEAQLSDMGLEWGYADSIARRMFSRDSVRFCQPDELRKVVAALTYEQKRRRRRAEDGDHGID